MNEKQSFVIEDLDDYHLVIKGDEEYRVRQELEAEVRLFATSIPSASPSTAGKKHVQPGHLIVFPGTLYHLRECLVGIVNTSIQVLHPGL